jgi:hypothetical protein
MELLLKFQFDFMAPYLTWEYIDIQQELFQIRRAVRIVKFRFTNTKKTSRFVAFSHKIVDKRNYIFKR